MIQRGRRSTPVGEKPLESLRILADQAFSRAAGAPLVAGNRVRLLKDATENYPAWLESIQAAKNRIHFESYIIHGDSVGRRFAEALAVKAREGVRVRVIYDWLGARGLASRKLWRLLRDAGVEVRCFNPPRLDSPFGWLNRDHRKMLSVDGRIGFVTGLCIGQNWVGDPSRAIEPWRDTGIEIEGPAVQDLENAFAQMWASLGPPVSGQDLLDRTQPAIGRGVELRIVATAPNTAGLYRFDQFIAAIARNSIWLTDAYFLATTPYVQALRAAAMDGVDVRLLLPRTGDIPIVGSLSRAGYRALLEVGVRIFEWNGTMLHAKTAVADGRWARVGSSNLNVASWLGNWELDVIVEDEDFGLRMQQMYLEDLSHSTEIVLSAKQKVGPARKVARRFRRTRNARGSAGRTVTGLLRFGNTVGAAMANRRPLGPSEVVVLLSGAALLLVIALIAMLAPHVFSWPVVVIGIWLAISLVIRAGRLYVRRNPS